MNQPTTLPAMAPGRSALLEVLQRASCQRVFVHDNAAIGVRSRDLVLGRLSNRYAEAALVLAQPGDLVVVERMPDVDYLRYLDALDVGPGLEGVHVLAGAADGCEGRVPLMALLAGESAVCRLAERLDRDRQVRLYPYCTDAASHQLAAALSHRCGRDIVTEGGDPAAVAMANRKDLMRDAARCLSVPWAPGEIVSRAQDADVDAAHADAMLQAIRRVRSGNGAFVRSVGSAGGFDNLAVTGDIDRQALLCWLEARRSEWSYLVEPLLPVCASPNIQLWVQDSGEVTLLGATSQRLDDSSAHGGNAYPHRSALLPAMERSAVAMTRWLSAAGFRGIAGLDFIETRDPRSQRPTHLLAEVNGRTNGATYGLGLADMLNQQRIAHGRPPLSCWQTRTHVPCRLTCFAAFAEHLGDLLYSHDRPWGVVPYNTGLMPSGHVYVLVMADEADDLETLEAELLQRLAGN